MTALVFMHGYICSLKSTVSKKLADRLNYAHLETKQLGKQAKAFKDERYTLLAALAEQCLRHHHNTILDGTFSKRKHRDRLYRLLDSSIELTIINNTCPDHITERRLNLRPGNDAECIAEWQQKLHEPITPEERATANFFLVNTGTYSIDSKDIKKPSGNAIYAALEQILEELQAYTPSQPKSF